MSLTRVLIHKSETEAKSLLKTMIVEYRETGAFEILPELISEYWDRSINFDLDNKATEQKEYLVESNYLQRIAKWIKIAFLKLKK